MARRTSELHLTYVCDGLFEFNAFITPEGVRVRAGIFRDEAFVPPYTAGVLVETRTYLDMWRSAAAAIVNAWPEPGALLPNLSGCRTGLHGVSLAWGSNLGLRINIPRCRSYCTSPWRRFPWATLAYA